MILTAFWFEFKVTTSIWKAYWKFMACLSSYKPLWHLQSLQRIMKSITRLTSSSAQDTLPGNLWPQSQQLLLETCHWTASGTVKNHPALRHCPGMCEMMFSPRCWTSWLVCCNFHCHSTRSLKMGHAHEQRIHKVLKFYALLLKIGYVNNVNLESLEELWQWETKQ